MNEIICTTQAEFDAVPVDFDGRVIVKFGTPYNRAVINRRFKCAVVAWDNSSVVARDNSSVVARDNSSVEAWGNSSVEAWDNSSVEGHGNVQIVDAARKGNIKVSGNVRVVYNPSNIDEYIDFHGLESTESTVRLFKAVHFNGEKYYADADFNFIYTIGDIAVPTNSFNDNVNDRCGAGINLAHKAWALNYGRGWDDLAILELECKKADVLVPLMSDGKVRARKAKVVRVVPLEECGLYGKMLAKQRARK